MTLAVRGWRRRPDTAPTRVWAEAGRAVTRTYLPRVASRKGHRQRDAHAALGESPPRDLRYKDPLRCYRRSYRGHCGARAAVYEARRGARRRGWAASHPQASPPIQEATPLAARDLSTAAAPVQWRKIRHGSVAPRCVGPIVPRHTSPRVMRRSHHQSARRFVRCTQSTPRENSTGSGCSCFRAPALNRCGHHANRRPGELAAHRAASLGRRSSLEYFAGAMRSAPGAEARSAQRFHQSASCPVEARVRGARLVARAHVPCTAHRLPDWLRAMPPRTVAEAAPRATPARGAVQAARATPERAAARADVHWRAGETAGQGGEFQRRERAALAGWVLAPPMSPGRRAAPIRQMAYPAAAPEP